jgi:TM2 domain-containing membrane protein YozV
MMQNIFKKSLLWTMIGAFIISAIIGIITFLIGDFGEFEAKILGTTFAIGIFSLMGLCSATILERKIFPSVGIAGIVTSAMSLIYTLILIWSEFEVLEDTWKLGISLFIIAFTLAHVSLLLLIKPKEKGTKITLISTVSVIIILALLLISIVVFEIHDLDGIWRVIGVLGILDVLGTIVTPILNKVLSK